MRQPVILLSVFFVWCVAARTASAQSLELDTDPDVPHWALGVTADPVAPLFGRYGARIEGAFGPAHAMWAGPAFFTQGGEPGLSLELGYHLWPLGNGVSGLFVGPYASASVVAGDHASVDGGIGVEGGFQYVWDGLVFGAGGGVGGAWVLAAAQTGPRVRGRVRVSLGYAWM